MPKRIGVFVDTNNLYLETHHKFFGKKISYQKYLDYIKDFGEIVKANAYGVHVNGQAKSFIGYLLAIGFKPTFINNQITQREGEDIEHYEKRLARFKQNHTISHNVSMSLDIMDMKEHLDIVFLGTNDKNLLPLINRLRSLGITVIMFASNIYPGIKTAATQCIEIYEGVLE